jgi:hypothetical protein
MQVFRDRNWRSGIANSAGSRLTSDAAISAGGPELSCGFTLESGCEMPSLIVNAAIVRRSLRTVGREIPNLEAISLTEKPPARAQSTICSRGFKCLANVETTSRKLTTSNTSPLV